MESHFITIFCSHNKNYIMFNKNTVKKPLSVNKITSNKEVKIIAQEPIKPKHGFT
jgi:hypothetical protein